MSKSEKELRAAKYQEYKDRATNAVREGKIFRVISAYDVPRVKYELIQRGYVESIAHSWNDEYLRLSDYVLLEEAQPGNMFEQALLSRLIGGNSARYMWITAAQLYDTFTNVPFLSKINIRNTNFGIKDGLHEYVQAINSNIMDKSMGEICHPRTHCITNDESINAFQRDYKATLAIGLILHLNGKKSTDEWLSTENGTLDLKILDYAMNLIVKYIKWIRNEIDDENTVKQEKNWGHKMLDEIRWQHLCTTHSAIIKLGQSFKPMKNSQLNENYIFRVKFLAEQVLQDFPSRKYDGCSNVWLLKVLRKLDYPFYIQRHPFIRANIILFIMYFSQGQGIIVTDNLKNILSHLSQHKKKFIIQKYIERPLLLYNTKFDIRSYFLVNIDSKSITFWTSPVSSIKFASAEFTLDNLEEIIHITNAAVQQKYIQNTPRDDRIPFHRMWSNDQFIGYLKSQNMEYVWHERIYPSMKKSLEAIARATCDNIEKKHGRFELFGCDWIVTADDYNVFLLEIQRPPGMGFYSDVSLTVCGKILEDTIRVTVDRVNDPTASPGLFEIIYQQELIHDEYNKEEIQEPSLHLMNDIQEKSSLKHHPESNECEQENTTNHIKKDEKLLLFEQTIQTYNEKKIEITY
uniref:CSON002726 protein n=1 Tax=Culicoides sonorensis TaxID=179676 RepID=A0A336MXP1_CULSO